MQTTNVFDIPSNGLLGSTYLAEVIDVEDPEGLARVRIRLLNADGIGDQDGPVWARVATPFAGPDYGAYFLPDVGDQVVASFLHGDPRQPIVIGSLWHGNAQPPERLGGSRVDRWTLKGKAGTRVAVVEENGGSTISLRTANGVRGTWTDSGGGSITLRGGGASVTISGAGVKIETAAKVEVKAAQVDVEAGQVTVKAAISQFQGVVQCDVLQATSVIGTTYAPGVGNVW